ncbi:MAG: pectate lyase [Thermoguttaceae bacterium]
MIRRVLLVLAAVAFAASAARGDDAQLRREAGDGLKKACRFFSESVSTEGGYLWRYSEDLRTREGEGKADDQTVWVQPPGTPAVGLAFLEAYRAAGDEFYLELARQAGRCLVRGQLRSGGWDYRIAFGEKERARYAYRVESASEGKSLRNTSTLDDNVTQAALRLLMALDQAAPTKEGPIHEAAMTGLETLLKVQFPIGAWPQRFEGPPEPGKYPVLRASYPDAWSREYPKVDYQDYYTFNDNAMSDVIDVMFEAAEVYGDRRYREAAQRAGDFMLMAQMPEPQPGWAQQYDSQMHPAWARKFEPPSITGGESQGVMRTLMRIYRRTGDRKYLVPIPRALEYYRKSLRPDGRLARFYELQTNRPLYFTKDYQLTYSDADMPTHYAFVVGSDLDSLEREYQRLLQLPPDQLLPKPDTTARKASPRAEQQARAILGQLDAEGRWVEKGSMKYQGDDDRTERVIDCQTFIANVRALAAYLATAPTK